MLDEYVSGIVSLITLAKVIPFHKQDVFDNNVVTFLYFKES